MYLSRLVLNQQSSAVRRDLANPYELHRTLRRYVGSVRPLWRLETAGHESPTVLIQTELEPVWSPAQVCAVDYFAVPPSTKSYSPLFTPKTHLRFRLRANPSVKRAGKRHGVNTLDGQIQWLQRKAEEGGFSVLAVSARDERLVRAGKPGHEIRVAAVTYDGRLSVEDPERFLRAVQTGIGSAKCLGFGLLSVAREKA